MTDPDFEQSVNEVGRTAEFVPEHPGLLLNQLRTVDELLAGSPVQPEVPSLIYRDPAGIGHLRSIGNGIAFGRAVGCDICFPGHREISQRQFEITPWESDFVLRDCGSTNGTFVNEGAQPTREHLLRDGDVIRVAAFIFAFVRPGPLDSF